MSHSDQVLWDHPTPGKSISVWLMVAIFPSLIEIFLMIFVKTGALANVFIMVFTTLLYAYGAYAGYVMGGKLWHATGVGCSVFFGCGMIPFSATHLMYSWLAWAIINTVFCYIWLASLQVPIIVLSHLVFLGYGLGAAIGAIKTRCTSREREPLV